MYFFLNRSFKHQFNIFGLWKDLQSLKKVLSKTTGQIELIPKHFCLDFSQHIFYIQCIFFVILNQTKICCYHILWNLMKIKVDTMKQLICLSFLTLCSCSLESDSCQANGNSNEPCKDNLTKDGVKIYGNLNGLHQDDPGKMLNL